MYFADVTILCVTITKMLNCVQMSWWIFFWTHNAISLLTHKLGNDAAEPAKLKHTEAGHFTGAILRDDLGQNIANVYESPQQPQSS